MDQPALSIHHFHISSEPSHPNTHKITMLSSSVTILIAAFGLVAAVPLGSGSFKISRDGDNAPATTHWCPFRGGEGVIRKGLPGAGYTIVSPRRSIFWYITSSRTHCPRSTGLTRLTSIFKRNPRRALLSLRGNINYAATNKNSSSPARGTSHAMMPRPPERSAVPTIVPSMKSSDLLLLCAKF